MSDKVCKNCRLIVNGPQCPLCQGNDFTKVWEGQIIVINPETSQVASAIGAKTPGAYALKIKN